MKTRKSMRVFSALSPFVIATIMSTSLMAQEDVLIDSSTPKKSQEVITEEMTKQEAFLMHRKNIMQELEQPKKEQPKTIPSTAKIATPLKMLDFKTIISQDAVEATALNQVIVPPRLMPDSDTFKVEPLDLAITAEQQAKLDKIIEDAEVINQADAQKRADTILDSRIKEQQAEELIDSEVDVNKSIVEATEFYPAQNANTAIEINTPVIETEAVNPEELSEENDLVIKSEEKEKEKQIEIEAKALSKMFFGEELKEETNTISEDASQLLDAATAENISTEEKVAIQDGIDATKEEIKEAQVKLEEIVVTAKKRSEMTEIEELESKLKVAKKNAEKAEKALEESESNYVELKSYFSEAVCEQREITDGITNQLTALTKSLAASNQTMMMMMMTMQMNMLGQKGPMLNTGYSNFNNAGAQAGLNLASLSDYFNMKSLGYGSTAPVTYNVTGNMQVGNNMGYGQQAPGVFGYNPFTQQSSNLNQIQTPYAFNFDGLNSNSVMDNSRFFQMNAQNPASQQMMLPGQNSELERRQLAIQQQAAAQQAAAQQAQRNAAAQYFNSRPNEYTIQ